jgi:hypothetical protein
MESKALALGKQVKAEALNSNVHQIEVTLFKKGFKSGFIARNE